MARPIKEGLDYFPLNVDFFDDPKILYTEEKHGRDGVYVATKLLAWVYRSGYFLEWNDVVAISFARTTGGGITAAQVKEMVLFLVEIGFFNKILFEKHAILTSKGIQKRWQDITIRAKRRGIISSKYDLVSTEETTAKQEETPSKREETPSPNIIGSFVVVGGKEANKGVSTEETPVSTEETTLKREETTAKQEESTQSKVKESKVNNDDVVVPPSPPVINPGVYGAAIIKTIDVLKTECLADRANFVEHICRQNKADPSVIPSALDEFNAHLRSIGESTKAVKDYRRHFQSWFKKQDISRFTTNQSPDRPTQTGRRTYEMVY